MWSNVASAFVYRYGLARVAGLLSVPELYHHPFLPWMLEMPPQWAQAFLMALSVVGAGQMEHFWVLEASNNLLYLHPHRHLAQLLWEQAPLLGMTAPVSWIYRVWIPDALAPDWMTPQLLWDH
jgi:hypothetical protein